MSHASSMLPSVTLTPLIAFPNRKECRSGHQMARTYQARLQLPDSDKVIDDLITFLDKGAGRNVYVFSNHPLVLKEYVANDAYSTHATEMKIYNERLDLRPFMPIIYGHCQSQAQASHAGYDQVLDVLIVEKAGASVKWMLEKGFPEFGQAGMLLTLQSIPIDVCNI